MAMPVNMILVVYVILCILSYDFNKLTMLYIHVHISSSMTNKPGLTFFLSIKYLSVCVCLCSAEKCKIQDGVQDDVRQIQISRSNMFLPKSLSYKV